MPLEQQIACILQSKHQQILKMPRHEQESRRSRTLYRPIEALDSADVLARWRPAYTSHSSGVHTFYINWHIQDRYHDYYYH